jgi:hypothetical protein
LANTGLHLGDSALEDGAHRPAPKNVKRTSADLAGTKLGEPLVLKSDQKVPWSLDARLEYPGTRWSTECGLLIHVVEEMILLVN